MKWLKLSIICGIAIVIVPYVSIKTLEMNGFCTKNYKFLSDVYTDQELIDKAILYHLKNQPNLAYIPNMPISDSRRNIIRQYSNIEDFKKLNPDCCMLNSDPYGPDGMLESRWRVYGWVYFPYYIYYTNNSPPRKLIKYIEYNSCGEMKEYSY